MTCWTKGRWGEQGSSAVEGGDRGGLGECHLYILHEPHRAQKGSLRESPAPWAGKSLLLENQQVQPAVFTPIPGHRKVRSRPFLPSSQLSFCLSVLSNCPASPQWKLPALQDPLTQRAMQGAATGLQPESHPSSYPRLCLVTVFAELPSITALGVSHPMILFFRVTPHSAPALERAPKLGMACPALSSGHCG